jgi:hypothetical protein
MTPAVRSRRTDDSAGVLLFTKHHRHPLVIEALAGLVERCLQAHP